MDLTSALVQGVLIGGLYAITGLGLTLVFGVLRMVNLAHGEMVLLGSYLAFVVCDATGLDPLLALPVVALGGGLGGWALHRFLLARIGEFGPDQLLVATFGISLLLQAAFAQKYGYDPRSLPAPYADAGMTILGVRVQAAYVVVLGVAVVVTCASWWALERTRWGAMVRASGKDPVVAGAVGIDVRRVQALVFGVATAIAAIGGVMVGLVASFTPVSGPAYLVFGFAVVVLGGIGSISGTFVAAMAIGVLQTLSTQAFGGGYRDFIVYAAFLLVLALRPQGLARGVVRA